MKLYLILSFIYLFLASAAFGGDREDILPPVQDTSLPAQPKITPEHFDRTQAVLKYYQVPDEADPNADLGDLQGIGTISAIQKILPFMSPTGIFQKLGTLNDFEVKIFQDLNTKNILDTQVRLKNPKNLSFIQPHPDQIQGLPLAGLRIGLDPGHMGSRYWDQITGKYVADKKGTWVSEGVINLQTALLLKKEFESLGAQVMLTHENLGPVSTLDYKTFDLTPFAQTELRESVHTDWFQNLVAAYPIGNDLYRAFDQSSQRRQLFSEQSRDKYFILRADLAARAEALNRFQPDIVLIIHYDTDDSGNSAGGLNPRAPKQTKAFVVGGYQKTEMGSRTSRKNFLRHLVDHNSWNQSLNLSRNIVHQLHSQLGLSKALSADKETYQIEPGVFSRNLYIPRYLKAPAISYLECTFFNNPEEFYALARPDFPMTIDGQNYPYSNRLAKIVQAIRDGVLQFATQK